MENYNNYTLLSYSNLYTKIDKLNYEKIKLYSTLANLDDFDDEDEIEHINDTLDAIDSSLEIFIYELRVREEFIFNVFGNEENQYEMCLN
jgi:hypothetical protein